MTSSVPSTIALTSPHWCEVNMRGALQRSNIVVLEPEVAEAFPNDKAVNDALRGLLEVAATTARLTRRSIGRAKKRRAG